MKPYYQDEAVTIYHGDCREVMAAIDENSVDAIVTDPPYGLEFMGKEWDRLAVPKPGNLGGFADGNKPSFERVRRHLAGMQLWHQTWAEQALRVLKPGGHALVFGGTRTYHRLVCALEDAGFEIRDTLAWLYGSGFPKSLDVSKAIDKAAGSEREVVGERKLWGHNAQPGRGGQYANAFSGQPHSESATMQVTAPATEDAKRWDGWGTALKPAHEPICLCRKPLSEKTVAANVLRWGTGVLNVDGCRRAHNDPPKFTKRTEFNRTSYNAAHDGSFRKDTGIAGASSKGRWPANVLLDEEAAAMLDEQSGDRSSSRAKGNPNNPHRGSGLRRDMWELEDGAETMDYRDTGGASRFFYCAKASRSERGEGNNHPTVKPIKLIQYLIRLITPPGGTVLDPFVGSGSAILAARKEGVKCIGIEKDEGYCEIAAKRMAQAVMNL